MKKLYTLALVLLAAGARAQDQESWNVPFLSTYVCQAGPAFNSQSRGPEQPVQRTANPGFNRDRSPVWVCGVRLHWES